MPPRRAGGRAGAVPNRAVSMTTRSRAQAGLNATATTPSQGPPVPAINVGDPGDEPLPVYLGPAQPIPGNETGGGNALAHPPSPRAVPIPPTPPTYPESITQAAASNPNSQILNAIQEIANNQVELSRSIARTQREMTELRSVVDSVRSSRASSRQSMRPGGEVVVEEREMLDGDETPGLQTVTDSDSDRDDWFEPASRSRNIHDAQELNPGIAMSASARVNQPTPGPSNQPMRNRVERREIPFHITPVLPTPELGNAGRRVARTDPMETRYMSAVTSTRDENSRTMQTEEGGNTQRNLPGGPPDSSSSDDEGEPGDDFQRDTPPHIRRRRTLVRGRRDPLQITLGAEGVLPSG